MNLPTDIYIDSLEPWDMVQYDGSSIKWFKDINDSDMILKPDMGTYFKELNTDIPTGAIICNVIEPKTGEKYGRDPRSTLEKAQEYLRNIWKTHQKSCKFHFVRFFL